MSRDFDPEPGQWYEDLDREEVFKVVNVDPDEMLVRIQWLDGEYEDLDLEAWNELDLETGRRSRRAGCDEAEAATRTTRTSTTRTDLDEEDEDDWDDDEDEDYDDDDDEYRDRE